MQYTKERRQKQCVLIVVFIFIILIRTVFPLLRKRCNRTLIDKRTVRNRLCQCALFSVGGFFY